MDLRLDPDDLNSCVQCGLCLPHCPTFRVTGEESKSPRGRIALMRAVQDEDAPITTEVVDAFATCVQCRGCEPACPSGVPYGHLMEQTRETLADAGVLTPKWQRLAFKPLASPTMLNVGSKALAIAQRARLVPKRLGISATVPLRQPSLDASGQDVHLFTGCIMDAWQRDIHLAVKRVVEAGGIGVMPTGDTAPCCGALHTHAGLTGESRRLADRMIDALDDGKPILVDSAGCGAAMKDYGHLLGTPEAEAFASRVYDIAEWLAGSDEDLPTAKPLDIRVAIQDPCHLRHVQRVHQATRTVLRPYVRELVELDDDGLCCGAGGAYSVLQPELAGQIRDRKLDVITATKPDVVVSANPGCSMYLSPELDRHGIETIHPMQLIDRALNGLG